MPHSLKKKQRLDGHQRNDLVVADSEFLASFDDLGVDVLPNIFSFLPLKDIMSKRRINKKSMEAVKMTIVPRSRSSYFCVESVKEYNAMNVMSRAMPNLQQLEIGYLGYRHKYNDGEDPKNEIRGWADLADYTTHDIEIISSFSKLQVLGIKACLNGRYPFLFNSFPLLQILRMNSGSIKWDLEMLSGLPMLKELDCIYNFSLTGNIKKMRALKDTLEKVKIFCSENVEGNFMDLADFPHLKVLSLIGTAVTGNIRDIGDNDFVSLQRLELPKGVYGCSGYECQSISEATDLVRAVYLLKKQRPALHMKDWNAKLSKDSPDWYEAAGSNQFGVDWPPFKICFVQAGSRIGYRWEADKYANHQWSVPCEVNWLDPEPDTGSSDYAKYAEALQKIESRVTIYRGFHQPPTEEDYHRLVEEHGG